MRRLAYSWELLCTLPISDSLAEFPDVEFCCARVAHTDPAHNCRVCEVADHIMVERRLRCGSPTCKLYGSCKYSWKVWICEGSNQVQVFHNRIDHIRDDTTECEGPHKASITPEMKKFILQQDECAVPPQLILSSMRRSSDILQPKRGYPTLSQVSNCAKYLRRLQGTKNSTHVVRQLVREHALDPTGDFNRAFCFGHREDENGHTYVGKGTDSDSFVVGVTSLGLVTSCIEYASPSRFTLFHADATFKLSHLGYPVITCGFSDASRSYQLAAIFIVSRRTGKEYAM
ncbi:hypothetical protein PF004_g18385, partial [Phytophthora fragariae]